MSLLPDCRRHRRKAAPERIDPVQTVQYLPALDQIPIARDLHTVEPQVGCTVAVPAEYNRMAAGSEEERSRMAPGLPAGMPHMEAPADMAPAAAVDIVLAAAVALRRTVPASGRRGTQAYSVPGR